MLLVGAGLQLALPSSTKLPDETELAPRRVHEPAALSTQEYPAMLANPIFAPDRKPDATAVPVSGGMNGFTALGVATAGDTATALVRGPGGVVQRLKPGDLMLGWKLVDVTLNQLTFERDKERRVLTISKGSGLAGPAGNPGFPNFRPGRGPMFGHPPPNAVFAQPKDTSDSDDDDDSDDDNN